MATLVHASDLHFGSHDSDCVPALLEAIGEIAPEVVVISGDLTTAGRHSEFKQASEFIRAIEAPVVCTPGNHDIPAFSLWERFTNPLGRYRKWISPIAYTRYRSASLALIAATSARPWDLSWNWSHGRLSKVQAQRVDRFLRSTQETPFRALVVHHPFVVPDDMPAFRTIRGSEPMLRALAQHKANLVLSGHLHRSFSASRAIQLDAAEGQVEILQAATATSVRHRNQPNAFNVIRVENGSFSVSQWIFERGQFRPDAGELE